MIIILILLFLSIKKARENERLLYEVEFYTDSLNRYTKVYNSESFSKLKKENKELYNRLKEKEASASVPNSIASRLRNLKARTSK